MGVLRFTSSKANKEVGARQNLNIRQAITVCLCREAEETQSSFSPDELKRAMKKIQEDMNPVSKDTDQQDTCTAYTLMSNWILVRYIAHLTSDL